MKASKYCTTFQMHEKRGSFQGVDTYDLRKNSDFSFCSVLLDRSESRSIAFRPDINSLISKHTKENILSPHLASTMTQRAKKCHPNESLVKKYLFESTFVPLEDSMALHSEDILNDEIKVILDDRKDDNGNLLLEIAFFCGRNIGCIHILLITDMKAHHNM